VVVTVYAIVYEVGTTHQTRGIARRARVGSVSKLLHNQKRLLSGARVAIDVCAAHPAAAADPLETPR